MCPHARPLEHVTVMAPFGKIGLCRYDLIESWDAVILVIQMVPKANDNSS